MRLTPGEIAAIKACARDAFGAEAVVRVFGSRLDDRRRGGDIDLHVQVPTMDHAINAPARFRMLLDRTVGEREYDILVASSGRPLSAIDRKALAEGEVL